MRNIDEFKGKNLVVLGGGESGVGAAVLGVKIGMKVLLSDRGILKDSYRKALVDRNIPFEEGSHDEKRIMEADVVVKSPGIPDKAPLVAALKAKGVPVVSEIEFAGWFSDSKMVCITGSNGKTTTTMLTHHIFTSAGIDAGLAGNVGNSLALQVAENPKPVYIIELSSFQLDGMFDFKADIAVLMNITPDHLDRYDYRMENYAASKLRIVRNQTSEDFFIYWADDEWTSRLMAELAPAARRLPFSAEKGSGIDAWTERNRLLFNFPQGRNWEIAKSEIPLRGLHNYYNTMAAALAARAFGVSESDIRKGVSTFKPVEHRLEPVALIGGVKWINDSKATNVASTFYALESMDTPTVLILGGTDKGNDYNEILPFVKQKVKGIVCMGVDNRKLMDFFTGRVGMIADTNSLEDAVRACAEMAVEGDTVLLSPCCASFDLFSNYEDRGEKFKKEVLKLQK